MGIPDHLTCLLRNLYAGQEATVRTGHGTTDWFQIGKGVRQGCCSMSSSNCMLPDLQTDFSRGRLGGLVFPSLSEFSTVYCDPHSQRLWHSQRAEIDVFLEFSCFFDDPRDVGNLISGSSAFSKSSLNIWNFTVRSLCMIL